MKNLTTLFTLLIGMGQIIYAQSNKNNFFHIPSTNLHIQDLEVPIHKLTERNEILWGTDYGHGDVYKSIDNGDTWTKLANLGSEYLENIQFVDDTTGFVSGDYGFVQKTMDGGKTWSEVSPQIEGRIIEKYRNDTTKNQEPDGLFVAYYGMHFMDASQGIVSGFMFNPAKGFRDSFKRLFYHTLDAGNNWSLIEPSNQSALVKVLRSSPKKNTNILGEYFISQTESWRAGKNKQKEDVAIRRNHKTGVADTVALTPTSYSRIMLRSIVFLNNDVGFIFGGSLDEGNQKAVIYQTTDAGTSWEYLPSDWPHIHAAIANEQYLWLTGKEGFMKRMEVIEILKNNKP